MKKGISLIVLVITIIVMIILAASVIIAMSNNGIIDRASQAVQLTDEKQVQDLAALAWAEAYLDEDRVVTMEKAVKDALAAQGVTTADWNIEVSDTGVVVTSKSNVKTERINLGGFEYQFEPGMTWGEWIASKYNTGGFYLSGDIVHSSDGKVVSENGTESETENQPIESGIAYGLFNGPLKD